MSEEAREEERQRRIRRAKDFAERMILEQNFIATKEDYALMVLSSFLLVKEHIIKKDTQGDTLYVSIDDLGNYQEAMEFIVQAITKLESPLNNISGLTIKDEKTGEEIPKTLAKTILIINKIRDSIAHDNYVFDENYENIIIDNVCLTDSGEVNFHITIPIYLLEQMVTISEEKYDKKSVANFKENVKNFFANISEDELEQDRKSENKNILPEYKIPIEEITQSKGMAEHYEKNDNALESSKYDTTTIIKRVNKELASLLKAIVENTVLTSMEKQRILIFLREKNLVDYDFHQVIIRNDDVEYITSIRTIISKVSELIPTDTSLKNKEKLAALYNYMQTVFSIKIEKQKRNGLSQDESHKYRYLKLSKFNPTPDENLKKKIKNSVSSFNKNATQFLSQIEQIPNAERKKIVLHRLVEILQSFIEESYKAIANQNVWVIEEIRNATLHANISISNNIVTLKDIPNKIQPNSAKFECSGSIEELFELTGYIDNPQTIQEHITFEEFLIELKHFGNIGDKQMTTLKEIIEMIRQKLRELSMEELFEQTASSLGGL